MPRGIGGEIAWWCPSLDSSGLNTTTLNDLTGNGNTGTLTNMPTTAWQLIDSKYALRFEGAGSGPDYVSIAGTTVMVPSTGAWSFSCWFNSDASFPAYSVIAALRSVTGTGQYAIQYSSDTSFGLFAGRGGLTGVRTTRPSAATWHHLALTNNGTSLTSTAAYKLYIDNVSQTLNTTSNIGLVTNATSLAFRIGGDSTLNPFKGYLDDLRVFNRQLSSGDVANLASKRGYQKPAAAAATLFFFQGF